MLCGMMIVVISTALLSRRLPTWSIAPILEVSRNRMTICLMKLYLMRHARTNYNELDLCNDDPARDVYVTTEGVEQAEVVAEWLREMPIERIVTSELPRTRQTAEIVNRCHRVAIEAHSGINDIRSGFDGRPVAEYYAAISDDPLRIRVNGGESLLDHKARVLAFIDWLKVRPEKHMLVVAHAETLRVFRAWFEGIEDERMRELEFGNCEVLVYEV